VFLKGCPLRCPWCCNPESLHPYPEIITRDVRCIRSARCVDACPQRAIAIRGNARVIDWTACDQCAACARVCRARAIEVIGQPMTVAEVVEIVGKDASYYRRTGGGITLSGGEPLSQWRFTLATLAKAKQKGWHTALDTTGYADWGVLEALLPHTDLFLYDVKHTNTLRHRQATGSGNERVIANLQRLAQRTTARLWVRRAVIPGFNEDDAEIDELYRLVRDLGAAVEKISLLPYHNLAEAKYLAMGRAYPYHGIPMVRAERLQALKSLAERHGLTVDFGR